MPQKTVYIIISFAVVLAIATLAIYNYFLAPIAREKVVVYAYRDTITGIDPGVEDDTGIMVLHLVYETLLRYNPKTNSYEYILARDVKQVDETTWRIILRDDAKFHDGSPVTAYDVQFSIKRSKQLYEELGKGLGYIWECVEGVEVIDEKTVEIKTLYSCDIRVSLAGAYSAFIYSKKVLELSRAPDMLSEELTAWFNRGNALGSGPYRLVKYEPEKEVILGKFEDWWGWKVINNPNAPDVVIIRIVEDPGEQERLLRVGHLDIASSIPRASLKALKDVGFEIKVTDTFHNFILMFNARRCPTNITEFRKAIAYAIPWDKIVEQALMGYGRKGSGLIPYGFPGYSIKWELKQDLGKAKDILNQIDMKCEPRLTIVITQGYEEEEVFASMLKSELEKLGITLEVKAFPWEQVKSIGQSVWVNPEEAPHLIINDWWPTYMVPYDYFSLLECLNPEEGIINYWNWAGYCSKEFDELLGEAYTISLTNLEKSISIYEEVQKLVFEDMPAVNLWDMQHIYAYNAGKLIIREEAFNPLYTYVIFFQYVEVRV